MDTDKETKKLTTKESRFVDFYTTVAKFNATKAHELAGYSARDSETRASMAGKVYRKQHIRDAIKRILSCFRVQHQEFA